MHIEILKIEQIYRITRNIKQFFFTNRKNMHMITDKKNKRKMQDIFLFKIECMHFPRLLHPVTRSLHGKSKENK